jgi:hypothetical protein
MKNLLAILMLFCGITAVAQTTAENNEVKKVVIDFFDAFHRQDTVALRKLADPGIKMQSISSGKEGNTVLTTNSYEDFLKSIVGIPSSTAFEEKLESFDIQVNGPLATVITPYQFYRNGDLSHCGVNSFTMFNGEKGWKIIYLIDTRRKEGCY